MSRNMSRELGPCHYNGNEIVENSDPLRGVAGLAPDAFDEWGYIFAAAPDLLAACEAALDTDLTHRQAYRIITAAIAKARGEEVER